MIHWKLTIRQKSPNYNFTNDIVVYHNSLLAVAEFVTNFESMFDTDGFSYYIESVEEEEEDDE